MARDIVLFLAFIITAIFPSSKGDIDYYVRSDDNNSTCPATTNPTNCRLFTEYAEDRNLVLDPNTSFVFLPGQHLLYAKANFSNLTHLSFRPFEAGRNTSVIVNQGGNIFLEFVDIIEIAFLEIQSRAINSGSDIPIALQVYGASDIKIRYCNFTNNKARALVVTNSNITLVGNQVLHSKRSWLGLLHSNATLIDNVVSNNNLENEVQPGCTIIYVRNSSLSTFGTNMFSRTGNINSVVAGIIVAVDSAVVLTGMTFFLENGGVYAGVIAIVHSTLVMDGDVTISRNIADQAGVIWGSRFSLVLYGNTTISDNIGISGAGVLVGDSHTIMIGGNATFIGNFGSRTGVLAGINYTVMIYGSTNFSGNYGQYRVGVIDGFNHTVVLDGNTTFVQNSGAVSGVIGGENYIVTVDGNESFFENLGNNAGVIYGSNSTVVLGGNAVFANNAGLLYGGVVSGRNLRVFLTKYASFVNNDGVYGGSFGCLHSQYTFSGEVSFVDNRARYGGAMYALSTEITFKNGSNVTFLRNFASIDGGGVYLSSGSALYFPVDETVSVSFVENSAANRGGGVFIQDSYALTYCLLNKLVGTDAVDIEKCFFQVSDYNDTTVYQTKMYYGQNHAVAGSAIYGGAVDKCFLETNNNALVVYGKELFDSIVAITKSKLDTLISTVSSDPYIVWSCVNDQPRPTNNSMSYTVYPGAHIQVSVIAMGQRNGTVPATIVSCVNKLHIKELEKTQAIPNRCSNISYTVYGRPAIASIQLYAEGSCLNDGTGLTVDIEVLKCPPGFILADSLLACVCHPSLVRYTNSCNPQDGTILRVHGNPFWVGYDAGNDGIILHSYCPFDYCITKTISFQVEDSDAQCNHDRSGLLCGECSEGLSLLLGSNSCEKCSSNYISLLLFFAAAGVILVAFLLVLNLTVAIGTINGLIFYANIVAANEALVFPSKSNTYLDILKVFIAWLNLDFGIKSCFYDGMDAYVKTWLQYGFPVYIWTLIGIVFLVSHFSNRAVKIFGKNPVAVLATLILLSYSKILRTVIEAFSSATLEYSQGASKVVWLNDGNVPFLDTSDGRHLGLFLASLLVLVCLFIPYTLILLTSQWLQIKSHWKVLSWLNRPQLSSFLDAYNAPYKPKHRYWTGLLLIVRLTLLVTTARTVSTDPSVIFLVIQIFVLLLLVWVSFFGGVYRKWYLNVLEGFFLVNLGLLLASIHHVQFSFLAMEMSSSEIQTSSTAATSTMITAALASFLGLVVFHMYLKVNDTKAFKAITSCLTHTPEPGPIVELNDANTNTGAPTSYITLREPLLDDA